MRLLRDEVFKVGLKKADHLDRVRHRERDHDEPRRSSRSWREMNTIFFGSGLLCQGP